MNAIELHYNWTVGDRVQLYGDATCTGTIVGFQTINDRTVVQVELFKDGKVYIASPDRIQAA